MQGRGNDDDDGGAVAMLANASDNESDHQSEPEEAPVIKKAEIKKGKKRVRIASIEQDGNEEDRALALLANADF